MLWTFIHFLPLKVMQHKNNPNNSRKLFFSLLRALKIHQASAFRKSPMKIEINLWVISSCLFYFFLIARSQSSLSQNTSPALQASHNASTATKELDDLMASLSDFKVSPESSEQILRKTFGFALSLAIINQMRWKWKLMYRASAVRESEKERKKICKT